MNTNIDIAFCFDENMVYAACAAIGSLLDFKNESDHYRVHCVCNEKAMEQKKLLSEIVRKRDDGSRIFFYDAGKDFHGSYEVRGISTSTYLRLTLHRVLEHLDKVIYSDVDVLFQGSLAEMWNTELGENMLGGVKGANNFSNAWKFYHQTNYYDEVKNLRGNYINAGVLLMNLRKIRETDPDELWRKMSRKQYHYQDQDILNITCGDKIIYLPLFDNVAAHLEKKDFMTYAYESIYSEEECRSAWKYPLVIHYTGEKPWKNRGVHRGKAWWGYVDSQADIFRLFAGNQIKNRRMYGFFGKLNRHLPF